MQLFKQQQTRRSIWMIAVMLAAALGCGFIVAYVVRVVPFLWDGFHADGTLLSLRGAVVDTYQVVIETDKIHEFVVHEHDPHFDAVTDGGHGVWISSEEIEIREDLWITSLSVKVNNADPITLHHAPLTILKGPGLAQTPCGNAKEFFIFANDNVWFPLVVPSPYAFLLEKGTVLRLDAMLHNPAPPYGPGMAYHDVSVSVKLEGVHARDASMPYQRLEVERLILSDTACDVSEDRTFVVPPGNSAFVKRGDNANIHDASHYTFTTSADLMMITGHTHAWDGGERLEVALGDELLTTIVPQRATDDAWSWRAPRLYLSKRVHAGEMVSISALYRNDSPLPVTGAMGIVGLYFAPINE